MPKALLVIAQGCEELEAVTIIDLLRRAGIEVLAAGLTPGPVRAGRGVTLLPDCELEEVMGDEDIDMVVLPGGLPGADNLANDARVRTLLTAMTEAGKFVAAICAAPRVLAKLGLLDGKRATAYPGFIDGGDFPAITYTGAPVERDGRLITGRGPGTAMDFGLELIEVLMDRETRNTVEKGLVRP